MQITNIYEAIQYAEALTRFLKTLKHNIEDANHTPDNTQALTREVREMLSDGARANEEANSLALVEKCLDSVMYFGPSQGLTLREIYLEHGTSGLLPYRQRVINEIAHPRKPEHKAVNSALLEAIDSLFAQAGVRPPKMGPRSPRFRDHARPNNNSSKGVSSSRPVPNGQNFNGTPSKGGYRRVDLPPRTRGRR